MVIELTSKRKPDALRALRQQVASAAGLWPRQGLVADADAEAANLAERIGAMRSVWELALIRQ